MFNARDHLRGGQNIIPMSSSQLRGNAYSSSQDGGVASFKMARMQPLSRDKDRNLGRLESNLQAPRPLDISPVSDLKVR